MPPVKSEFSSETAAESNDLIASLLTRLEEQSVRYCHWKSNWKIERWLKAEGDLDLLIAGADASKFSCVVSGLGFKKALAPPEKELPGVVNYYGFDAKTQKIVHLHAHYQLVFGHDLTKNYRLPIESPLLKAAVSNGEIPITSPEIEFILFVLRMVLKFSAAETIGRRLSGKFENFSKTVQGELEALELRIKPMKLEVALWRNFPMVSGKLFKECLLSLRPDATAIRQMRTKYKLESSLAAHARQPRFAESATKLRRRVSQLMLGKILRKDTRKRFEKGGALIAFVGGDGAGKSTCVNEISRWLSKKFQTRAIHIGKPPRTALTTLTAAALKSSRLFDNFMNRNKSSSARGDSAATILLQRFRHLCTARDRYHLYVQACRFAARGGIVVCDRYPLSQVRLMDCPKIAASLSVIPHDGLTYRLIELEKWYYRQIMAPDLLVVLRVDPDTAVSRKTDEAPEHVRPRSAELWRADWKGTNAKTVDANRKLPEVLTELRSIVWEAL